MPNRKIIATTSLAVVVSGAVLYKYASYRNLYKTFPALDHKTARKAYRRLLCNALLGKYESRTYSDFEMEMLLLDEVDALSV